MHGLFLTWTQNLVIHRWYIMVFTHKIWLASTQPLAPHCPLFFTCHPSFLLPAFLFTWRISFLAWGAKTHPFLSLVCYQLPTLCCFSHPNTPHRSSYNIYTDDINNISRPRLTQYQLCNCVSCVNCDSSGNCRSCGGCDGSLVAIWQLWQLKADWPLWQLWHLSSLGCVVLVCCTPW